MGFDVNRMFVLKHIGKRLLGRPSRRQKDTTDTDLCEVSCDRRRWIEQTHSRV
jgi:hypothetical protein